MIFNLKDLDVEVIKKFDGINNYYNPSHFNGKTIFRRESKFEDKLLVSDIVDDQNNIILQHRLDDNFLWSYEDARFINENEISVCCCKRDKNDLVKVINVEFKKYDLITKEFTHFKTQNKYYEKHWQFYNDIIIYHINPYTILDSNENVIYKKQINWKRWTERFDEPRLSTNVFEIDGIKYIIFHSSVWTSRLYYNYFIGLLRLNEDLSPVAYTEKPLFVANREYSDNILINDLYNWRKTELNEVVKYEVIFPMNVIVDEKNLNIYSGLNDCSAVNIKINKNSFIDKIKNQPFMLV